MMDRRDAESDPSAGKQPPQEMRLRAPRAPVTRLSRKVLLGLGTAAAVSIGGALFLALRPQHPSAGAELYNTNNSPTPDELAGLPKDYAGLPKPVPQLGPPLPGDLGRPILNSGAPAPTMGAAGAPSDADQQRLAQEQEAALTSHLFAATDSGQPVATTSASASASPAPASAQAVGAPASGDQKLAFLNGNADQETISPEQVQGVASPYVLQAGAIISAALITGLNSDLPGQVTAQVTENVYDSVTGRVLLIPQGAKLIGQYDAQVAFGQSRALLVWTRLIMPNGTSILLERQPATDTQGYAGLSDEVNNHWGMLFKAAILSTLLSVGAEVGTGTGNNEDNLADAIRQSGSQSFNQIGEQVIGRSLNVQPTIIVRPGFRVRVLVTHDLVLQPYGR